MTSATEDQGVRLDCGYCVLRPWNEGDKSSLVRHANNYEVWCHIGISSLTPTPVKLPTNGSHW
jgi:RimJ/RimL family protein N-acetyltransferase